MVPSADRLRQAIDCLLIPAGDPDPLRPVISPDVRPAHWRLNGRDSHRTLSEQDGGPGLISWWIFQTPISPVAPQVYSSCSAISAPSVGSRA